MRLTYKATEGGFVPHCSTVPNFGGRRDCGMNSIIVISSLLAATAFAAVVGASHVTTTQYHSQDGLGQYSYGYSGGPSAKEETRTADGVTRGSFSYVDANGILQSASYVSDPVNGFRVSATNLPQAPQPVIASVPVVSAVPVPVTGFDPIHGVPLETPEVATAKAAHFAAHGEALARLARRWKRSLTPTSGSYSYTTPSGSTTVVSAPTGRSFSYSTIASAPAVGILPAPVGKSFSYSIQGAAPISPSTLYQSRDDFGQYSYGYSDGLSSKSESRSADGVTQGSYSYVDSNGIVQNVKYVADAGGFRVHATNLPVAPAA